MKAVILLGLFSFSVAQAAVDFVRPKNNDVVPGTFPVEFSVSGMKVEKAGVTTPLTGHHHLIIDGAPIKKGQLVPKDQTHIHFGDASAKTTLTLPPGKHTLTLQFADGAHMSYGEDFAKTISIVVK